MKCPIFILLIVLAIHDKINAFDHKKRLVHIKVKENIQLKKQLQYHPDILLNFTERLQKYGYPSDVHTTVTEDGYILKVFRILKRPHCETTKKPPVLLHHGLFVNSISYTDAGPKVGLAYLLADACFDVWCSNSRGTEFSRNHTKLDPDKDPEFWQFSFHEIGLYDLSAFIYYIIKETGSPKVNYVSHSQAVPQYMALASLKPEVMDKVGLLVAMAPAVFVEHSRSPVLTTLAKHFEQFVLNLFNTLRIQEILYTKSPVNEVLQFMCRKKFAQRACIELLETFFDGRHRNSVTQETFEIIFGHTPDGVSLKNLVHFSQLLNSRKFQQYDYGEKRNMKTYGAKKPPEYELKKVTTPTLLIYGENDHLVNASDVRKLGRTLPNVVKLYRIEDTKWNHLDYLWSIHIPKLLLPEIVEWLNKYSI
ncbi:unnamed protein product [Plutella xylostella]|uniref:Lipase n=1 Tax=Plutella xylostella TaxID=51655 RepID=A0A8S4D803_PLUXY|nr:unnamed protein product [Plutella xylostella]